MPIMSKPRKAPRGRQLLSAIIPLTVAAGLFGATAPAAHALSANFNCGLIAVNSWCQYAPNHSWYGVEATWNGTAVPMCAKIINSSGNDNGTRRCATAAYVYSIPQPSFIGPNTWALVANGNSGTSKTISGFAWT